VSPTDEKHRKRKPARVTIDEETPKTKILRSAHVHRSRAHTSSVGRRRQVRRDTK
jgi:hypothetical protein